MAVLNNQPTAVILSNNAQSNSSSSFAIIGNIFMENFQKAGVTVSAREVSATYDERLALAKKYTGQSVVFFLNVLMGESVQVIPGMKNVALPAYEFSRGSNKAVVLLNQYDEIWTTTRHVAEILVNSGATTPILKVSPALYHEHYPRKSCLHRLHCVKTSDLLQNGYPEKNYCIFITNTIATYRLLWQKGWDFSLRKPYCVIFSPVGATEAGIGN